MTIMSRPAVRAALAAILAHAVVSAVHGEAHRQLGVGLSAWQTRYVGVVIVTAPLIAGVLLLLKRLRAGGALLGVSMAGSLLFGLYYHFIFSSPDHVSHQPAAGWGLVFMATSVLLALTEVWGCWAGLSAALGDTPATR
jgi:hypothetical protein